MLSTTAVFLFGAVRPDWIRFGVGTTGAAEEEEDNTCLFKNPFLKPNDNPGDFLAVFTLVFDDSEDNAAVLATLPMPSLFVVTLILTSTNIS